MERIKYYRGQEMHPRHCKHCASLRRNTDRRIGLGAAARTRRRACAASLPAFSAATVLCAAARDRAAASTTSGRPARRPHATAAPTTPYVSAARAHTRSPQPTTCGLPRAPAVRLAEGRRQGLGGFSETAEAEEEVDLGLTRRADQCLRARAGER